jgi:hypothetical protein
MTTLLLALVLTAPADAVSEQGRARADVTCAVNVTAFDGRGHERPARRVLASLAPAVVFRGRVSTQEAGAPPLLFDVFNPRGQRYQVLVATPRVVTRERDGQRVQRMTRTREATLAVAGSSIAWTSMYGRWRVEPRIEGTEKPCGKAEHFTIRP